GGINQHDWYLMLREDFRSVVLLNNRTSVGEFLTQSQGRERGLTASIDDPRGVWTHLDLEIKLNSPGVRDGVFTFYVNGTQLIHQTDVEYRDSASDQLQYVMVPGQHGG